MDPQASSTCSHSATKRGMDEAHPKEERIAAEASGHGHPGAIFQPGELPEHIRSPTWPSSISPFVIRRRNGALPHRAGLERCRMDELDGPYLHVHYIHTDKYLSETGACFVGVGVSSTHCTTGHLSLDGMPRTTPNPGGTE